MKDELVTIVISLDDQLRNGSLEPLLSEWSFTHLRVTGVDGRSLTESVLSKRADCQAGWLLYGQELTATQVGCALSHREAYRVLLATGAPWALILEDDAVLHASLQPVADWIATCAPSSPVVVECFSQGRVNASRRLLSLPTGVTLQRLSTYPGSAVAYFINRAAAELALGHESPIASRADWPAWAAGVSFWRTVPNVVSHGYEEATPSTMIATSQTEGLGAKALRWALLLTGLSYLRLREHYPQGIRQYYGHAVNPSVRYWTGRAREKLRGSK